MPRHSQPFILFTTTPGEGGGKKRDRSTNLAPKEVGEARRAVTVSLPDAPLKEED